MTDDKEKTLTVKVAQMPTDMQEVAFKTAKEALEQKSIEKDVAQEVKMHFDKEYEGTWHCICGNNFGCSITHDTLYMLFFSYNQTNFLLFKTHE